jgi:hypothetical protein
MRSRDRRLISSMFLIAACASAGGGTALYRRDVGAASRTDAVALATRVAQQHNFELAGIDTVNEVQIQTEWLKRPPFTDETALGVAEAESRLLVIARPRGLTAIGANYSVNITVENRLRLQGSNSWSESMNTPMFTAYADRISNDLKQLITNIGVRKY